MKHATTKTLQRITSLLAKIREFPLQEKKRGIFYYKGRAFLHFHEDGDDVYADLKSEQGEWVRINVEENEKILAMIVKLIPK